jgi:toxin ParE1/3/4
LSKSNKLRFSRQVVRDLQAALDWSVSNFGPAARSRYRALIRQALADIEENPVRPGSRLRTEVPTAGVRTFHISLSRDRVARGRVGNPRHLLLYRVVEGKHVEVARLLHDSFDFDRQVADYFESP